MKLTLNFTELGKNDALIAGGKGASLGEMTQAGIPVPPGFVVLSTTFDEFIKEADLVQEIDAVIDSVNHKDINSVEVASEKIQALIKNAKMPEGIALEIKSKFKDLNTEFVAVRSSATAEDGADNAWAGQLDSFLNTKEANLLEKVQHCWASLFTPRAIFYRFEKGLHTTKISVAVVVQKMVNSEVSGIAFSVHPVTEDRNQMIIEAGFGLGEAIVSGSVTPDSYVVEKEPRHILDINVSSQTRALYRVETGGNEWLDIPEPQASSQVLSETQILEFADLIMRIENHYGFPCDIEWAFEKGKFYIVQSRPITTLGIENKNHSKNDEWIFMYGISPLMPSFWATAVAAKERVGVISAPSMFQYFDGKVVNVYYPKNDIDKWKEESKKFLDEKFFKEYLDEYNKESKVWWNWIRKIEKKDYSKINKKELLKDHSDFCLYQRDSLAHFAISRPEVTYAVEQRLEEIIKKEYTNDWTDVVGILTTPLELDDIQKEYVDWLKLIEDNSKVEKKDYISHTSNYPWLVFGQFSDEKVIDYLSKRRESEVGSYKEEMDKISKRKKDLENKQQKIYSKFKDDFNEVKYLVEFLQRQSKERMNIKSFWIGSYYLARNMWNTISNILEIQLWDLLMFFTTPEIQNLLNDKFTGDVNSLITNRRSGYAVDFSPGGDVNILNRSEAEILYNKRIKKLQINSKVIKGQVASSGFYKGIVRKVIPGDLDMLQDSIKNFKQGEILVTTMTQPNMMVIAQKAGAIVTDEGGITSHAAIIARELKIPCIVGCLHTMEILSDGDNIEVDAKNGIISLLE
jgi:phosphohistidine swiveling domain-containing protein